ncbi:hypothetical protein B9G55_11315 [Saccharibacillus sp. O16]|nr:hypothetical protein B9G55_11315 [Saccharibacillus sp. O16]
MSRTLSRWDKGVGRTVMNKYQKMFIDQTAGNLERILRPGVRTDERTLYRMLHSIKGTSGTIDLHEWYRASLHLLERFDEHGDRVFSGEELSRELVEFSDLLETARQEREREEGSASALRSTRLQGDPKPGLSSDFPPSESNAQQEAEPSRPSVSLRDSLSRRLGVQEGSKGAAAGEAASRGAGFEEAASNLQPRERQQDAAPRAAFASSARSAYDEQVVRSGEAGIEGQTRAAGASAESAGMPESAGTVLLLDDDVGLLALLKDVLEEEGFTVFATPRFDKAVEWFYEMLPDCAVLDVLMPEQSGFDMMERMRELCDRYMIPVVLMTGKSDLATRIRAYEGGADDFLTKPMNPQEFVVRIRRLIRRRRRLTGQLLLDQTTGAYGMPFLERELARQIDLLEGQGDKLAVAAVQLDGLRSLNERTGYREGDRLLKIFSDTVRRHLRPQDIWARDRANQFFLLQPGKNQVQSAAFLSDILNREELRSALDAHQVSSVYGVIDVGSGMSRQQALAGAIRAIAAARRSDQIDQASLSAVSRQLRLAVIDDDPLIRNILQQQLQSLEEEYELEIRSFADGEEFLSDPWHVGGTRYLLILDRMMPRMNGMEVLTRLHGGGYEPIYTVLMLTGVGDERGIAEAMRAGTDDYMTKPFSLVELEARVRRLLGKVGSPT